MSSPPVRRVGQAERSRQSRERILAAAVDGLVAQGYAGTSTHNIQTRAGVSRGRLLHQFPSKDELLVAAAAHISAARLEETEATVDTLPADSDPRARLEAVIERTWDTFDSGYFWAATELWTAARTSPGLAEVILPAERTIGATIRGTLDRLYGPVLAAHPLYPAVRDVVFTSMRGVALTYAFDRRDHATEPALRSWKALAAAALLRADV